MMQHSKTIDQEAKEELKKVLNNKNLEYYWMDEVGVVEKIDYKTYIGKTLDNELIFSRTNSYYGSDFILGSDILFYSEFTEKVDNWLKNK